MLAFFLVGALCGIEWRACVLRASVRWLVGQSSWVEVKVVQEFAQIYLNNLRRKSRRSTPPRPLAICRVINQPECIYNEAGLIRSGQT